MDNKEEEDALIKDIGYSPTTKDDEWERELKRNGVSVERMKRIDKLIEDKREEGEI